MNGLEGLMKSTILRHFKNEGRIPKKLLNMKLKRKNTQEMKFMVGAKG